MNKQILAATTLSVGATSGIGSIASQPRITPWYSRLRKPSYVPRNGVFPVAWTTLYADIAVSSATAIDRLRAAGRDKEARNYVVALAASSADLARRTVAADPRAGAALAPYPLWCAFATVMSGHIWILNRR